MSSIEYKMGRGGDDNIGGGTAVAPATRGPAALFVADGETVSDLTRFRSESGLSAADVDQVLEGLLIEGQAELGGKSYELRDGVRLAQQLG